MAPPLRVCDLFEEYLKASYCSQPLHLCFPDICSSLAGRFLSLYKLVYMRMMAARVHESQAVHARCARWSMWLDVDGDLHKALIASQLRLPIFPSLSLSKHARCPLILHQRVRALVPPSNIKHVGLEPWELVRLTAVLWQSEGSDGATQGGEPH